VAAAPLWISYSAGRQSVSRFDRQKRDGAPPKVTEVIMLDVVFLLSVVASFLALALYARGLARL
jgi:hypothetical protein